MMRTQRSTLIADLRREAAHLVLAVTVEAVFTLRSTFLLTLLLVRALLMVKLLPHFRLKHACSTILRQKKLLA